jgi:hypothetical protein
MEEEAAIAKGEDDLTGANVFNRATGDFDYVAGPKGWQHALAANAQAQTSGSAEGINSQCRTLREPGWGRNTGRGVQCQDVFREFRQAPPIEILPHDKACVSKTCS